MTTVLVVDDSKTTVLSITSMLAKAGYEVASSGDGTEALAALQRGLRPNLVLTDLNMPKMDGITLIREVRKLPGMRFTPILMLTTESQQAKRDEAKTAGATGWLVKPVQADALLGVLAQVLPKAR